MKIDGRCFCGEITFTSDIDPNGVQVCHCTDCQIVTGTAFRLSVRAEAADTQWTGKPASYVKTAASGRRRRQGFCGTCGTHLFSCEETTPTQYMLRVGAITQKDELRPIRQVWTQSKLPWVEEALRAKVE